MLDSSQGSWSILPELSQPSNGPEKDLPSLEGAETSQSEHPELASHEAQPLSNGSRTQTNQTIINASSPPSWFMHRGMAGLYISLIVAIFILFGWATQQGAKKFISAIKAANRRQAESSFPRTADAVVQAEAERMLERLARGDLSASEQVIIQAPNWTGRTGRTARTDQFLEAAINSSDMRIREASLHAFLALDGVPQTATGRAMLERAVGNPNQRAWALWLLGSLGHLGIDPVHSAKIIDSYLNDPDIDVRSGAVNGLDLLATDETIPMLLDRFRNDPSPVIQERAICGLSQSGMFTHAQRMIAAKTLLGWLNDSLLTVQQRTWTVQALQDITGASLGSDSAAWRKWWSKNSHT